LENDADFMYLRSRKIHFTTKRKTFAFVRAFLLFFSAAIALKAAAEIALVRLCERALRTGPVAGAALRAGAA